MGSRVPQPTADVHGSSGWKEAWRRRIAVIGGAGHPFSAYVDWLTGGGYRGLDRVELDTTSQLTLAVASDG